MTIDRLPSQTRALVRTLVLVWRFSPRLIVVTVTIVVLSAAAEGLLVLWLAAVTRGVANDDQHMLAVGLGGSGLSVLGMWTLGAVSTILERRLQRETGFRFRSHIAAVQMAIPTIDMFDSTEAMDRLKVLKDQVRYLEYLVGSLVYLLAATVRTGVVAAVVWTVNPLCMLLLVAALVPSAAAVWAAAAEDRSLERTAALRRQADALGRLTTSAEPLMELLMSGSTRKVADRRTDVVARWRGAIIRRTALATTVVAAAWVIYGFAFFAIVHTLQQSITAVAMATVATLGAVRLAQHAADWVSAISGTRMWLAAAQRLVWLERLAAPQPLSQLAAGAGDADEQPPRDLVLREVTFRYHGATRDALAGIDLRIRPGTVVVLVGENGSGKSTLANLMLGLYEPTSGTIHRTDSAPAGPMSTVPQDFARFELPVREAIGIGDVDQMEDWSRVERAAATASADEFIQRLPSGYRTRLGSAWPEGIELSGGQWQKIALARGIFRADQALQLLVMDEPTAALDAETEHQIVATMKQSAQSSPRDDRITVIVSHRLSTASVADLVVVLHQGRITEVGTHAELMKSDGRYAGTFVMQANSYL